MSLQPRFSGKDELRSIPTAGRSPDIHLTLYHPSRCAERFELTEDKDVVINLKQEGDGEKFQQDEYCVGFEQVPLRT